jgi:hypothetical protein
MAKVKVLDESPYKVLAKVGNEPDGRATMVTYKTRNLIKTFAFLKKQYPGFVWMNVFDRETRVQIANFTINRPPLTAKIPKGMMNGARKY